jgi:hypothetical protein
VVPAWVEVNIKHKKMNSSKEIIQLAREWKKRTRVRTQKEVFSFLEGLGAAGIEYEVTLAVEDALCADETNSSWR